MVVLALLLAVVGAVSCVSVQLEPGSDVAAEWRQVGPWRAERAYHHATPLEAPAAEVVVAAELPSAVAAKPWEAIGGSREEMRLPREGSLAVRASPPGRVAAALPVTELAVAWRQGYGYVGAVPSPEYPIRCASL